MEAVILSGGFGTRLRPLTWALPKPLLPIVNRPMVQHILDALPDEVDHAVLAAGYKVDQIRAWADRSDHRVALTVVDEDEPLGTAGAIANVADHITDDFLCFNGDVLSTAPLQAMIDERRARDALGVLALWPVDDPSHFGVVALAGNEGDPARPITRFVEKPEPGSEPSNLINAGTYCFRHDLLDHIPVGRKVSLEREVFPRVIDDGEHLLGMPFDGHWVDCGRPDVYLEAHHILIGEGTVLGDDARLDGEHNGWASLGAGAVVEAGATVVRSVLLDGARVEAGARVVDSVIGQDATVGKDAQLVRTVVGQRETIAAGTSLEGARIGGPQGPAKGG